MSGPEQSENSIKIYPPDFFVLLGADGLVAWAQGPVPEEEVALLDYARIVARAGILEAEPPQELTAIDLTRGLGEQLALSGIQTLLDLRKATGRGFPLRPARALALMRTFISWGVLKEAAPLAGQNSGQVAYHMLKKSLLSPEDQRVQHADALVRAMETSPIEGPLRFANMDWVMEALFGPEAELAREATMPQKETIIRMLVRRFAESEERALQPKVDVARSFRRLQFFYRGHLSGRIAEAEGLFPSTLRPQLVILLHLLTASLGEADLNRIGDFVASGQEDEAGLQLPPHGRLDPEVKAAARRRLKAMRPFPRETPEAGRQRERINLLTNQKFSGRPAPRAAQGGDAHPVGITSLPANALSATVRRVADMLALSKQSAEALNRHCSDATEAGAKAARLVGEDARAFIRATSNTELAPDPYSLLIAQRFFGGPESEPLSLPAAASEIKEQLPPDGPPAEVYFYAFCRAWIKYEAVRKKA